MNIKLSKNHLLWSICFSFLQLPLFGQDTSHIEANVPNKEDFHYFLKRDLKTYFDSYEHQNVNIKYQLLRSSPTQSGVAFPKYYAWVQLLKNKQILDQGAVRLAAINKTRFEVTNFLNKKQILQDGKIVGKVFPAALCPDIFSKANAK
jgi:hypothetical protein